MSLRVAARWWCGFLLAIAPGIALGVFLDSARYLPALLAFLGVAVSHTSSSFLHGRKSAVPLPWTPAEGMLRPGERLVGLKSGLAAGQPTLGGGVIAIGPEILEFPEEARLAAFQHELRHIREHHWAFIIATATPLVVALPQADGSWPAWAIFAGLGWAGMGLAIEAIRLRWEGVLEVLAAVFVLAGTGYLSGGSAGGVDAVLWGLGMAGGAIVCLSPLFLAAELSADLGTPGMGHFLRHLTPWTRWRAVQAFRPHPPVELRQRLWAMVWGRRPGALALRQA